MSAVKFELPTAKEDAQFLLDELTGEAEQIAAQMDAARQKIAAGFNVDMDWYHKAGVARAWKRKHCRALRAHISWMKREQAKINRMTNQMVTPEKVAIAADRVQALNRLAAQTVEAARIKAAAKAENVRLANSEDKECLYAVLNFIKEHGHDMMPEILKVMTETRERMRADAILEPRGANE